MEQLYNPRVNKVFTSLHFKKNYFDTQEGFLKRTIFGLKIISVINKEKKLRKMLVETGFRLVISAVRCCRHFQ